MLPIVFLSGRAGNQPDLDIVVDHRFGQLSRRQDVANRLFNEHDHLIHIKPEVRQHLPLRKTKRIFEHLFIHRHLFRLLPVAALFHNVLL